ncbi:hypothetical protein Tco_0388018, partial [Tanacetum coccineum]
NQPKITTGLIKGKMLEFKIKKPEESLLNWKPWHKDWDAITSNDNAIKFFYTSSFARNCCDASCGEVIHNVFYAVLESHITGVFDNLPVKAIVISKLLSPPCQVSYP